MISSLVWLEPRIFFLSFLHANNSIITHHIPQSLLIIQ